MIATIITIALAFTWLLHETRFFTIQFESTEYQRARQSKVNHDVNHDTKPEPETTIHYKPSEFVPADMPEIAGSLNIICKRG